MNSPTMIWRLRITPVKVDSAKFKIVIVLGDKEAAAEPRVQELVNYELAKENPSYNTQLYLQQHSPEGLAPLFIVELPTMGWQFILDSRMGITQWYVNPISDVHKQDLPMVHGFFSERLIPFSWGINNLLVALQRAYLCLSFQNNTVSKCQNSHYIVNILLKIRGPPNGPDTKFTTHFVSANTRIVDIFTVLAGAALDDGYTLVQWVWSKEVERYDVFKCCRYSEVRTQNTLFKDGGWVGGQEVWLLPTCQ